MMLHALGETVAGTTIEDAVGAVAGVLPSLRAGEMGASTSEVGDMVVERVMASADVGADA